MKMYSPQVCRKYLDVQSYTDEWHNSKIYMYFDPKVISIYQIYIERRKDKEKEDLKSHPCKHHATPTHSLKFSITILVHWIKLSMPKNKYIHKFFLFQ